MKINELANPVVFFVKRYVDIQRVTCRRPGFFSRPVVPTSRWRRAPPVFAPRPTSDGRRFSSAIKSHASQISAGTRMNETSQIVFISKCFFNFTIKTGVFEQNPIIVHITFYEPIKCNTDLWGYRGNSKIEKRERKNVKIINIKMYTLSRSCTNSPIPYSQVFQIVFDNIDPPLSRATPWSYSFRLPLRYSNLIAASSLDRIIMS